MSALANNFLMSFAPSIKKDLMVYLTNQTYISYFKSTIIWINYIAIIYVRLYTSN